MLNALKLVGPSASSLLLILCLARQTSAQAPPASDAAARAAVVAPFLDEQTLLVARIDLAQIDASATIALLGKIAPATDADFARKLPAFEQMLKAGLAELAAAQTTELYAVVSLADLPKEPVFIVAPLKAGGDGAKAAAALKKLLPFEASETRASAVVLGKAATIERLKTLRPSVRPELTAAFTRAGNAAVQVVACLSDDTRRVMREMLPRLPDQIGGGSGKTLADGLSWISLALQPPPKLSLAMTIQARDPDAAASIQGMIVSGLALLVRAPDVRKHWPDVDAFARLFAPRISGDKVLVDLADQAEIQQGIQLLVAPLQAARTAAGRRASMDNLKQLGLAMHNFHDSHQHLPPQSIRGKTGQPLLSWRVAILPYVEQSPLYEQFRLDEPWDSPHNLALVEKMPAVYAAPGLGDERRAKGLTSYLVPLSRASPALEVLPPGAPKAPDGKDQMIFDLPQGTRLQQITDGTSNTLLLLEVHPKFAVPWTKPEDLVIDERDPLAALLGQPGDSFATLFCDGSARMIKTSVAVQTILYLLQMNDGNAIGDF